MIILQPRGGLCNRMRAITAGMEMAKRKNTKCIVMWKQKAELNASFYDLFKPIKGLKVINYRSSKDIREILLQKLSNSQFNNSEIRESMDRGNGELDIEIEKQIKLPVYIWSCEQFYHADYFFRLFQPIDKIESKVNQLINMDTENLIGVHIRRTDQIDSIKYSKTENFAELMKYEIEKNPNTVFYLATDDMSEEQYFRSLFKGRIISNENRVLSRDSSNGISDAVIDLYCLARCSKIIGSYWSSFTDVAAILGNCTKVIAGIDNLENKSYMKK